MHNILILHNNNKIKKEICEYWSYKGFKGAIMLIGAIGAPLGDCFLKNILEIFLEKPFKFKNIYLYYFVQKFAQKMSFQSFLSPFTKAFTI